VTKDIVVADDGDASDTLGTDKEELAALEDALYKDLEDLEGEIVRMFTETWLRDTSMIGSNGTQPTKVVDVQPTSVRWESGFDALIEGTLDL